MKTAYVAGRYRAPTEAGVYDNIQRARAVAAKLWQMGYAAFCPHANTAFFGGIVPDDTFLDGDLAWLPHADIVVMVDGWEQSSGARAERDLAEQLGKPIYTQHDFPVPA